jgi:hypothetical protein
MAVLELNMPQMPQTLAAIRKALKSVKTKKQDLILEPYKNGREKGWCIKVWTGETYFSIAFAENRKSDDIVVYSDRKQFDMQGNVPSENAYNERKYFPYQAYDRVARHVVSLIKRHVSKKGAK